MMSEDFKTKWKLTQAWRVVRWILFFPAGMAAGFVVFLLTFMAINAVGLRESSAIAEGLIAGVAAAISIYVAQALSPGPRSAAVLASLATLAVSLFFSYIIGPVFLWGWLSGAAPVLAGTFTRRWRWSMFLPVGLIAGATAAAMVTAIGRKWDAMPGSATSNDVTAYAAVFLGSAVYILAIGWLAPSHRPLTLLLMANVSYLAALATWSGQGNELYLGLSWVIGTALGCLPVVMRVSAALEPWSRAGAVEGKNRRYKGTAPYQDLDLDRKTFFGREQESRHFLSLVLAERLVVLFAKSGMGKSSLINASVLEPLRAQGYFPIVVRLNDPGKQPLSSLIEGVRKAANDAHVEILGGDETSAWLFFKKAEFWSERDDLLKPVLILDQFEELFTMHAAMARKEFTSQLAELVRGRGAGNRDVGSAAASSPAARQPGDDSAPEIKIVIALREDFLANLEDLSNEIPAILHNRFRLGPLNAKAARDAIIMPAGLAGDAFETTRFSYQEAAVERIIAFLARRRTGAEGMEEGEVEPVQMQLICHYLEEMVRARQAAQKGEAEIQITEADLGGEEQMRQVLEGFYDRTIASVRPRSKARAVRRLCEFRLISASGRRLTQDEEEIQRRYRISGELLRQLVDARLLRAEPRLGGTSYEVSHDRLVEPILQSRKKRAMRMRMFAAAAVPLFLAVTISQGWSTFERSHRETEIKAHLMEPNALSAIQSAGDLARRYSFDHTKLLEMAGPVLNPSAFAIFTRLPNDSWEWKEPSQARKILEHIRRTYPAFLNAPANTKEEAGANARVLLGAIVSTLDHAARTRPENDRPFANEVAELRADILEAYRKKFPPTGPNSCSSETSVVVYNENQILHRIQQNVVLRSLYEGCLEPRSETGKTADNPIPNQAKDLSDFFGYRVSWYEAAAYAALRGGKLPSKGDLDSAKGKINFEDGEEWLRDEKRNKISISGSAPRHPFRVVW